jgi:hypothetical protein
VIFDSQGKRVGGARLLAVVTLTPGEQSRYLSATQGVRLPGRVEGHNSGLQKWLQQNFPTA